LFPFLFIFRAVVIIDVAKPFMMTTARKMKRKGNKIVATSQT